MTAAKGDDRLATYRSKRDARKTPEPVPAPGPAARRPSARRGTRGKNERRFVVQEHHATALHWDFRLEHDGVLVSWAVPKGLPLDPKTNHLAVPTEDHPLEYGSFEGEIPAGEYGGGKVTLWDHGTYEELKWTDREVMVVLHGSRIEGRYVLFDTGPRRASSNKRSWMLHRMDEAPEGYEPMPEKISPMLATLATTLPTDDTRWSYEFKWDGIRAITAIDGGRARVVSRNGNDLTASFPEIRDLAARLGARQVVLDGEIVAFDEKGVPRFQLLQPRIHATDANKAKRLSESQPVTYLVFDLLYEDGTNLLDLPYTERRDRLERLPLEGGGTAVSPRFAGSEVSGEDVLRASLEQSLEGLVAKRNDSRYLAGKRSPVWVKVKNIRMQEVVIGGFTPGKGRRASSIGSLLLGIPDPRTGELTYIGQVGTGFTEQTLADLTADLERLQHKKRSSNAAESSFSSEIPARYRSGAIYVRPELVGEVAFAEWTKDGRLRHPVWRGLRTDKEPAEVVRGE